jgi:hypothetical protein
MGSAIRSTCYRVLHRPVEPAPFRRTWRFTVFVQPPLSWSAANLHVVSFPLRRLGFGLRLAKCWLQSIVRSNYRQARVINSYSRSRRIRTLAKSGPLAISSATGMANHLRSVGWVGSRSEGSGIGTGPNRARYWPPQTKWNRSRSAHTATLPQLQNSFIKHG